MAATAECLASAALALCHAAVCVAHSRGYPAPHSRAFSSLTHTHTHARQVLPKSLDSVFFANGGAEAVENALRLARHSSGKDGIISFLGGYHGRTSGALAVTSSWSGYRGHRAGPLPTGTFFAQYPYEHAGVSGAQSLESVDMVIKQQVPASEVAAVLIEPILGEGGYVVPPPGYLKSLREWCTANDILLIADEVQSGAGRTGKMWAVDHEEGVIPDILISAKGIASGYQLSCVFTRAELSGRQPEGSMGGT